MVTCPCDGLSQGKAPLLHGLLLSLSLSLSIVKRLIEASLIFLGGGKEGGVAQVATAEQSAYDIASPGALYQQLPHHRAGRARKPAADGISVCSRETCEAYAGAAGRRTGSLAPPSWIRVREAGCCRAGGGTAASIEPYLLRSRSATVAPGPRITFWQLLLQVLDARMYF